MDAKIIDEAVNCAGENNDVMRGMVKQLINNVIDLSQRVRILERAAKTGINKASGQTGAEHD